MRKALFPLVAIGLAAGALLYLVDAGYIRRRQPSGGEPAKAAPVVPDDDGPVPPGTPPSPQARLSLSPLACPEPSAR